MKNKHLTTPAVTATDVFPLQSRALTVPGAAALTPCAPHPSVEESESVCFRANSVNHHDMFKLAFY